MEAQRTRNRIRNRIGSQAQNRIRNPARSLIEYVLLVVGSFCVAASFNVFLNPNRIVSGGVAGISTVVHHLTGIEPAWTQWLLNIPILLVGFGLLGGRFGMKTVVGTLLLPLCVLLTSDWQPPTSDILLASIFGGIGVGTGLGLVFRGRGSTGGLDLIAQIVNKYTGLSLGFAVVLLDGIVIVASCFVFTPERALYALIGMFITGRTIDLVQLGPNMSKIAWIITGQTSHVRQSILIEMNRGLTCLQAAGGYTGEERTVLMTVVSRREIGKLKAVVHRIDPHAFVIISNSHEVLGQGFKLS